MDKPGRPGRLVSARLTAWYCGLFSLSLAILFGFVYVTLAGTLRKANEEYLHSIVKQFADAYRDKGLQEIKRDASQKRSDELLIRISDPLNQTLFASLPYSDPLGPAALAALEARGILPNERVFALKIGKPGDPQNAPHINLGDHIFVLSLGNAGSYEFANTRLKTGGYLLQIGRNTARQRGLLARFAASCLAVTVPVMLLALAGGALMANRALRPLRNLTETVRSIIATGKLDARISPDNTAGELRDLVISFDQMLEKIEGLMEGMRGVLDNVAHDLRTPITRLRGVAELALRNPGDPAVSQEALADCVEESERVITMLNTLMDISEVETGAMKLNLRRVNIAQLARQLAEFYAEAAEEQDVIISMPGDAPCEAVADENRLRQAVANLLDNAVKYTPAGGSVEVSVRQAGGHASIIVRDTGIGIPAEELSHIWERLYRADKSRSQRGLGLGLSLVRAIARAHGGECTVKSEPGKGSQFTLRIPDGKL
jgi:heavy metal sensor kinase